MSAADPRLVVHVQCSACGMEVHVFPTMDDVWEAILGKPDETLREVASKLALLRDDQGRGFAVARSGGAFSCPECGAEQYAPQITTN